MKLKSGLITFFLGLSTISLKTMEKSPITDDQDSVNDLVYAASIGDTQGMYDALKEGADINGVSKNMSIIVEDIINGYNPYPLKIVYHIEEYNALKIAIEKNQLEAVKFLIEHKADLSELLPAVKGKRGALLNPATPLTIALGCYAIDEKYNIGIIDYLLKVGQIKNWNELSLFEENISDCNAVRREALLKCLLPYLTNQLINGMPDLAEAFMRGVLLGYANHISEFIKYVLMNDPFHVKIQKEYLMKIFSNGIAYLEKLDTPTLKALSQTQIKEIVEPILAQRLS